MQHARGNSQHLRKFMRVTHSLANARLGMEHSTGRLDTIGSLDLDLSALSVAAISKHGGASRGRLETIVIAANDRADLHSTGVLELEQLLDI